MLLLVALCLVCTYKTISLHIPFFLHNNKRLAKLCKEDPLCPFKDALLLKKACWGYEKSCSPEHRFSYPLCTSLDSGCCLNSHLFCCFIYQSLNGYGDLFSETWKAFTDYVIIHLKNFDSKRVCFRDVFFSLLPRMRYGLFYNTPLISDCHSEGLFKAFSQHVLYRLGVSQDGPKVNIALKTVPLFEVKLVDYKYMPFLEQIRVTHNSDIFFGMHGAGLTHLLFLPDWAVIFELYNCQDESCYRDLARLRGVHYMTWQKRDKVFPQDKGHHPTLGEHPKFTIYTFDVEEFMQLVLLAAEHVTRHPAWHAKQARDEL
uniref:EGF domain-specific O-linked N-acetylglucosamine transferase n=1 Tax=Sinocyclocheilus grahami TaxID=75366 RepID=A0A672SY08_SINGR